MGSTVIANMRTVVHKKSNGMVMGFPDVCQTPQPSGPPVPVPYPNMAMSQDASQGAKTVKADGNPVLVQNSKFSKSTGDEAGTLKGITSLTTAGAAVFVSGSATVIIEKYGVARLADLMVLNELASPNTPPFPEVQPPNVVIPFIDTVEPDNEGWDLTKVEEGSE